MDLEKKKIISSNNIITMMQFADDHQFDSDALHFDVGVLDWNESNFNKYFELNKQFNNFVL